MVVSESVCRAKGCSPLLTVVSVGWQIELSSGTSRSRLLAIHGDTGFVASFQFLLGLALSASPGVKDPDSLGEHCRRSRYQPFTTANLALCPRPICHTLQAVSRICGNSAQGRCTTLSRFGQSNRPANSGFTGPSTSKPLRIWRRMSRQSVGASVKWRVCSLGSSSKRYLRLLHWIVSRPRSPFHGQCGGPRQRS